MPDEGCCTQVLHTAGRHGLSQLGLDALAQMGKIGVVFEEYHFAPVVESLCRENKIAEAFGLLSLMRASNVLPTTETAYPIFRKISVSTQSTGSI